MAFFSLPNHRSPCYLCIVCFYILNFGISNCLVIKTPKLDFFLFIFWRRLAHFLQLCLAKVFLGSLLFLALLHLLEDRGGVRGRLEELEQELGGCRGRLQEVQGRQGREGGLSGRLQEKQRQVGARGNRVQRNRKYLKVKAISNVLFAD